MAIAAALVISSFGIGVKAEGETTSLKDKAGITPGSILYPADKILDEIKIALSFTDGSKIESITEVAEERLGESEVLQESGKTEDAAKVLAEANEKMERAAKRAKEVAIETKDIEEQDKLTKLEKTLESLAVKQATFEQVLKNLEGKSPEELKEKLQEVMDKNAERKLAVASMVDSRQSLNDARKALKDAEKSGDAAKVESTKAAYEQAKTDFTESFNTKQQAVNKNEKGQKSVEKSPVKVEENKNITGQSNTQVIEEKKAMEAKQETEVKQTGEIKAAEAKQKNEVKQGTEIKENKKPEQQAAENKDKEKTNNGQGIGQEKKDADSSKGNKDNK